MRPSHARYRALLSEAWDDYRSRGLDAVSALRAALRLVNYGTSPGELEAPIELELEDLEILEDDQVDQVDQVLEDLELECGHTPGNFF